MILSGASFFQNDVQLYKTIIGGERGYESSQGKIYDGMCANYTFDFLGNANISCFTYTQVSTNQFKLTWVHRSGTASWIENKKTRTISNSSGLYGVRNGSKAFLWLFTNISIGDLILISVDGSGNHLYNVTNELCCNYTGIGDIEVWVLQDVSYPQGIAWYEKSTGILINGTFIWYFDHSYDLFLISTTIFAYHQDEELKGEILEYSLFIFLPLAISTIGLAILRKRD